MRDRLPAPGRRRRLARPAARLAELALRDEGIAVLGLARDGVYGGTPNGATRVARLHREAVARQAARTLRAA